MTMNSELIEETIKTLNKDVSDIEDQVYDLSIYSNGSLSLNDVRNMSSLDRNLCIKKIITKLSKQSGTEWM
jgi:predicted HAD superfamily hydrolase